MATATGTHDIDTLLATRHQTVAQFGEDTVLEVLRRDTAAHNLLTQDMLSDLSTPTTDRLRRAGTSFTGEMIETDEYGRAPTQKNVPGQTVGFPLRKYQYPLGWTRDYLKKATPADLAQGQLAAQKAHRIRVLDDAKRALFLATNYTFNDLFVDKIDLPIKRLVNADGAGIPDGPNGEKFDGSTHTHYVARVGTLANSDVDSLITNVTQHGHTRGIKLVINTTNIGAISALSKFTPLTGALVIPGANSDRATLTLDVNAPADNRIVGVWDGNYPVWVKPWAVSNYVLCYAAGEDAKPLCERYDTDHGRGLLMAATIDLYPLRIDYNEVYTGFGVWTRTNGALLYIGGTSWTDPSI